MLICSKIHGNYQVLKKLLQGNNNPLWLEQSPGLNPTNQNFFGFL
jgi:hypothetical protein